MTSEKCTTIPQEGKKRERGERKTGETNNNISGLRFIILVISLKVNDLSTLSKK